MVPHPDSTPLFMVEALRERCIRGPLLLHRKPLANFALTLATARQEDLVEKTGGQALLVADFLRKNEVSGNFLRQAWYHRWWSGRYALRSIIVGTLLSDRIMMLRYVAFSREFFLGVLWFLRHPVLSVRIARYVLTERELSSFLRHAGHEFGFDLDAGCVGAPSTAAGGLATARSEKLTAQSSNKKRRSRCN
jgi:hypothetical protein